MAARLGNVLYWAACLVAAITIFFSVWSIVSVGWFRDAVLIQFGFALLVWLVGRAAKYVLGGT